MTKSELIRRIHDESNYNFSDIEKIVDLFLNNVINGLKEDGKVVISGFGTFERFYQEGYIGVNPSTGEQIKVEGCYKTRFNISKKVNGELKNK